MKLSLSLLSLIALEAFHGRSQPQSCISNIDQLADLESAVQDYTQLRSYTLCPNSIFQIGLLDHSNEVINGTGSHSIPIRPNMEIKCGDDGSRDNNCFVYGGDVQVDATSYYGIGNGTSISVDNVLITGVTFSETMGYSVLASRPGSLKFHDCEFKMNEKAEAPIYLDYFDPLAPDNELVTTFEQCSFTSNIYFGQPAQTAVIVSNSIQNRINLTDSDFQGNDMVHNNTLYETDSFLIDASGPLTLERNCFMDNTVGVSVAVVYGVSIEASNNYGSNSNGDHCDFIANFESDAQLEAFTPQCISFDATSCQAGFLRTAAPAYPSDTPSLSPSQTPSSIWPSSSPSATPSAAPTIPFATLHPTTLNPSALPTTIPTIVPSLLPSFVPSEIPTLSPSFFPSGYPTKRKFKPTKRPSRRSERTDFPTPQPTSAASGFARCAVDVFVPTAALVSCVMFILFG